MPYSKCSDLKKGAEKPEKPNQEQEVGRGGARNFPTGGLTLPTRGLKYGFQGTTNAKNLRKILFSPSDGG